MQAEQAAGADGTGIKFYAGVAQLVEQRIRNAQVTCSSHATSSSRVPRLAESPITGRAYFYALFHPRKATLSANYITVEQNRSFAYKRLG